MTTWDNIIDTRLVDVYGVDDTTVKAKSLKFLSPQQATVHFGISSRGTDFAEHKSQQAEGN